MQFFYSPTYAHHCFLGQRNTKNDCLTTIVRVFSRINHILKNPIASWLKHSISVSLRVLLILGYLTACTTTTPSKSIDSFPISTEKKHFNIKTRETLAKDLATNGYYYGSLIQWKILQTIQPDNQQYQKQIETLTNFINARVTKLTLKGRQASAKQMPKAAKIFFLKALALNPLSEKTSALLTEIENNQMLAKLPNQMQNKQLTSPVQQEEKIKKQTTQAHYYLEMGLILAEHNDWHGSIREINKYLSIHPNDPKAYTSLAHSYAAIAKQHEQKNQLEQALKYYTNVLEYNINYREKYQAKINQLKNDIADNYYIEGVKIYRDNIDKAINYWKRALAFKHTHVKANMRLEKTLKMKKILQAFPKTSK